MKIEELFGTLQQSVVATWRKHLRTHKYSKHMALDEFYKEMPEKVDDLIEAWMGENGRKVNSFENLITSRNMGTLAYLKELKRVCKEGYSLMNGDKSLEALLDDIVELINSTLYKVKELNESQMISLQQLIEESLVNEAKSSDIKKAKKFIADMYKEDGDLVSVSSCFHWLSGCNWEDYGSDGYIDVIQDINNDVDTDMAESYYGPVMSAMAKIGKDATINIIKDIVNDESELKDYDIK